MYNGYDVKDTDSFEEGFYPKVAGEVAGLHKTLFEIQVLHKTDIIISFLKFHSIKSEWLEENGEIARRLTSGTLEIAHLESLFNSCRNNLKFSNDLEAYIKAKLA